jgi:aminoglycoside phosphotransferase (APT) family kinase protein
MGSEVGRLVAAARRWPLERSGLVEPISGVWSHSLFGADLNGQAVVVKVFGDVRRDEHVREWDALCALGDGDLAPEPLHLSVDDGRPAIVMSRVEGRRLGLADLTESQLEAFVAAHHRVHCAWPEAVRQANSSPAAILARTSAALTEFATAPGPIPSTRARALQVAATWTRSIGPTWDEAWQGREVYCRGDPNSANYLWSGDQVTLVDFEDAGRNDPAFELADMVEHAANRDLSVATVDHLSELWDQDRRRPDLLQGRRIIACFWLVLLEGRERQNLPPRQVTATQQAERVLELLS